MYRARQMMGALSDQTGDPSWELNVCVQRPSQPPHQRRREMVWQQVNKYISRIYVIELIACVECAVMSAKVERAVLDKCGFFFIIAYVIFLIYKICCMYMSLCIRSFLCTFGRVSLSTRWRISPWTYVITFDKNQWSIIVWWLRESRPICVDTWH